MKIKKLFLLIIICYQLSCGAPVRIEYSDDHNCCMINTMKLGEYMTIIKRVEIIDVKTNELIWLARPMNGVTARFNGIKLCKGVNQRVPSAFYGDKDKLEFRVPGNHNSFNLVGGRDYLFKIVSPEHFFPGKKRFRFH